MKTASTRFLLPLLFIPICGLSLVGCITEPHYDGIHDVLSIEDQLIVNDRVVLTFVEASESPTWAVIWTEDPRAWFAGAKIAIIGWTMIPQFGDYGLEIELTEKVEPGKRLWCILQVDDRNLDTFDFISNVLYDKFYVSRYARPGDKGFIVSSFVIQ